MDDLIRWSHLSLLMLLTSSLCLVNGVLAQGQVVKPKPSEKGPPHALQPKEKAVAVEGSEAQEAGSVRLGILPFFSTTSRFDEAAVAVFDEWFKAAVSTLSKEASFSAVESRWIPTDAVDKNVFQSLPSSRIRGVAGLLNPLTAQGLDGIIGCWIESKQGSDQLVLVFYLPERIELEGYKVSANFERATLEAVADVGYVAEETQKVMADLLRKSLRRMTPPAAAEPPATPPTVPPVAGENPSGEMEEAPSRDPAEEEPDAPKTFAVLDFSREFLVEKRVIAKEYSEELLAFSFGKSTASILNALGARRVRHERDPEPVTVDQIDAPPLALDPTSDPHAREKALFARAGPAVDLLVLGHLRQERTSQGMSLWLYVRLLRRSDFRYFMAEPREWQPGNQDRPWDAATIRGALQSSVSEVLNKAGVEVTVPKPREIILRRGHTLFRIAKRCYGKADTAFTMEVLTQENQLDSPHKLLEGKPFKLPLKIGQHKLQDRKICR
ncbi:MAG: hypothetical protein SX243_00640 [Acidobacteriota bacterium]|nr:hypothetical protein [Acidobacteriota bacterium]